MQVERPLEEQIYSEESFKQQAGESLDDHTTDLLKTCHQIIDNFPGLIEKKPLRIGSKTAVSGAVLIATAAVVVRRIQKGQDHSRIVREVSPEEIQKAPVLEKKQNGLRFNRLRNLIQRQIARAKSRH